MYEGHVILMNGASQFLWVTCGQIKENKNSEIENPLFFSYDKSSPFVGFLPSVGVLSPIHTRAPSLLLRAFPPPTPTTPTTKTHIPTTFTSLSASPNYGSVRA